MPWNGTGYASAECLKDCSPGDPRCLSGICNSINWTDWSTAELQHFVKQHGTTVIPVANGWVPGVEECRACRMEDNGAQFAYETSPSLQQFLPRVFAAAKRASTPERQVKTTYYFHSFVPTGQNDSEKYADSRILDQDLRQQVYLTCHKGNTTWKNATWKPSPAELPLFYGTLKNSYGKVLEDYVNKIFRLGFAGVYHDEYGESNTA